MPDQAIQEESHLYKLGRLGDCAIVARFLNEFLTDFGFEVRILFRGDWYEVEILSDEEIPNPAAVADLLWNGLDKLDVRHYEDVRFAAKLRTTTATYWTHSYEYDEVQGAWISTSRKAGFLERLRELSPFGSHRHRAA